MGGCSMQTTELMITKKELENKVNNMLDHTLLEMSNFFVSLSEMRTNIINEREGLDELDSRGIALDEMLLLVEEAQTVLNPYAEMYEEVFHNLNALSYRLSRR